MSRDDLTELLQAAWRDQDRIALDRAIPQVYDTLKRLAAQRLGEQRGQATLNPTALVHEALLRLIGSEAEWSSRTHFLAVASLQMRSVLVDHARARLADKRGGGAVAVTLRAADAIPDEAGAALDLLALDQALHRLAAHDARMARVVEMTYFGGMQRDEIAAVVGISVPTVDRDLRFARAFLGRELAAA